MGKTLPEPGDTYLYTLHPTRLEMLTGGPTDAETAAAGAHWERLAAAHADGTVLFAGRTLVTDESCFAAIVYRAESPGSAQRFAEADPAVEAGVFTVQVFPFEVMLTGTPSASG